MLTKVSEHFDAPLRFAARLIRFRGVSVLFVTLYLWASEGLSERNHNILMQVKLIKDLLQLPVVCFADFNIPFEEFADSGWLDLLNASPIHPGVTTTTSASSNRVIDFGFISNEIKYMFVLVVPIRYAAWSPHYSFVLGCNARPRSITGVVQCVPKSLPFERFSASWEQLDAEKQSKRWFRAQYKAHKILRRQHKKTGVSILGRP